MTNKRRKPFETKGTVRELWGTGASGVSGGQHLGPGACHQA